MGTITCKQLAAKILCSVDTHVSEMNTKPTLSIVKVGNDPASQAYVNGKIKDAQKVGIDATVTTLADSITQQDLNSILDIASADSSVTGIILQLPLPRHLSLDAEEAISHISPVKDVDGLVHGSSFKPCTALGIFAWLKVNVDLQGKHVVIINRSKLVGRPLADMLLDAGATVTVCHSKTHSLSSHTMRADIVVVATGKPDMITPEMLGPNTMVLVDVGITRGEDGKLHGDCKASCASNPARIVTPVPGGVGLLTRACLLTNLVDAAYLQNLQNK